MTSFSEQMSDRFMNLVVSIIKMEKQLCKTYSGRHVYGQLFRAGTSAGANYEESRAGESKADFVHKLQIVLKELRESHYWVNVIIAAKFVTTDKDVPEFLKNESAQLTNIIAKSVVTAKSNLKSQNVKVKS
jgi:four helix bundle protein